jgi:hypothetical protein
MDSFDVDLFTARQQDNEICSCTSGAARTLSQQSISCMQHDSDFITPVSPVTSAGKYHPVAMAKSSVTALTNALGQRPRDISGPLWDLQSTNPVPVKVRCALTQT